MPACRIRLILSVTTIFLLITLSSRAQYPQWHNYTSAIGVTDFVIDGNDIWITSMGGLVKLNKVTGTYVNYNGGNFGLTRNDLFNIDTDTSGLLFISGPNFVNTFDKDTSWLFTDTLTTTGTQMPQITLSAGDKAGNIYACSSNSLYFIKYHNNVFDTINFPNLTFAKGIAIDSSDHVWIITSFGGVAKYDGSSWQVFDSSNSALPIAYGLGICVDHNNKIYALFYESPFQGALYSYQNSMWTLEINGIGISNSGQADMFVDATNNIWLTSGNGSVNGIIKYDGTGVSQFFTGTSNDINEFQIDDQGTWYYATDLGFYSYDGIAHKKFDISNADLPTNIIEKVVIDKYGVKWFISYYGVTRFDGTTWHTFNTGNSNLGWDHITDIYADDDHDLIWVTFNPGFGQSGIAVYDGFDWTTITPTASNGFYSGYGIAKATNGNLWFLGTSGVAKYDYSNWVHYNSSSLPAYPSGNIVADSSGNVFVASYNPQGIWKNSGGAWQFYDTSNFINPITFYLTLYSGPGGEVYAVDDSTIYTFNGSSWNVITLPCDVNDPFSSVFAHSQTNELWISNKYKVSAFDGTNCDEYTVSRLPDLSGIVQSVAKDSHDNYWITYYNHCGVTVYNYDGGIDPESLYGYTPPYKVSGFVYIDVASNGVFDSLTDIPFANRRVMLLPDSSIHFTNSNGVFNFAADSGNYSIELVTDSVWQITTDSLDYHFTITNADSSGFDFGLMDPNTPTDAASIDLTSGIPRCFTSFPIWINYTNQGLNTLNGVIRYQNDPLLQFNGSNPPHDSTDGTYYFWNVSGLTTFQQASIMVSVQIDSVFFPPVTHLVNANFLSSTTGFVGTNLSFQGVCSYDPNDKAASPEGAGLLHEIAPGQQLNYTIRFQNYGNDTAFYVMILDTLDAGLDYNTLQVLGSSHPCEVSLSPAGLLAIKFMNIGLLWEAVDTLGSQGYFKFRIKPKAGLANNTVITNSASVYFDFNMPVITNAVFHTISYNLSGVQTIKDESDVFIYPNPAHDVFTVVVPDEYMNSNAALYDIAGRRVYEYKIFAVKSEISISELPSGVYFLEVKSLSGVIRKSIVKN